MKTIIKEPTTPAEWQEAVDQAAFLILLQTAVMYGLVKTKQKINRRRCDSIVSRGLRVHGIRPKPAAELAEKFLVRKS